MADLKGGCVDKVTFYEGRLLVTGLFIRSTSVTVTVTDYDGIHESIMSMA